MSDFALAQAIAHLEKVICPEITIHDGQQNHDKHSFRYVPLNIDTFCEQVRIAYGIVDYHIRFIDVGCGIGTKCLLAQQLASYHDHEISGIEFRKEYIGAAKRIASGATIIHGDALEHTYTPYNIVYFYRPFISEPLQQRLEHKIADGVKVGSVVLANNYGKTVFSIDKRFVPVTRVIYLKIRSKVK